MSSMLWDDRDLRVVYSPGWLAGGLLTEYKSTTMYTDCGGATATISFHGVRIGVYGTVGSSNSNKTAPRSEYSLDGNSLLYQPTLAPLSQRNQQFYQSPELAKENHTLVVTNLIDGSSWLYIDYFVILTGETTMIGSDISATAMPNTMTAIGGTPNRNIPIIAGTVGGAVVLSLLLFLLYLWRRRRILESERNVSIVQSAWAEDVNYWTPVSPPIGPCKTATSSIPSTFNSPPMQSKSLRNMSLPSTVTLPSTSTFPSTSNHTLSFDFSYLPAPPEYMP